MCTQLCVIYYRENKYIVLYCIVLYYIILYCILLHYIVMYFITLYCIVFYCIVFYCLYRILMYCIVLYLSSHPYISRDHVPATPERQGGYPLQPFSKYVV